MLYVLLSVVASVLISGLDLSVPFQAPPPPFPTCAAANKEIGTEVVLGFISKQICIIVDDVFYNLYRFSNQSLERLNKRVKKMYLQKT